MDFDQFEKYTKEDNFDKYKKTYAWKNAIGLQDVDKLTPSNYLYEIANKNIEDDLSFEEASKLLNSYYETKKEISERTEEADKVSLRIAEIISSNSFVFSPMEYINIHKRLFLDIYENAGKIRDYNISKKEWVLDGKSVIYGNSYNLKEMLEYDFDKEKQFSYKGLNKKEFVNHIARFISDIWQIHIFEEGNTRTTAVFLIQYLKQLGFNVDNDLFANYSWYFRNSLVRANYENYLQGVEETTSYLEMFLENLLFNGNNELNNKKLHINFNEDKVFERNYLTKEEQELLALIKQNPNITQEQCSEIMNKSIRSIKNYTKTLIEKSFIERINGKKKGYWKVKYK